MGPQFLYVDEDWANSSLRRKLFGRPRHQGESIPEEEECGVRTYVGGWWVTLGEVLFALKNGYWDAPMWMSCLQHTDRQTHMLRKVEGCD